MNKHSYSSSSGHSGRVTQLCCHHGLPLLLFTALAVFTTWPLALHFSSAVPGEGVDTWQNIWNMWWLKQALLEGRNPFFTHYLQYPDGTSLLLHTLNPFNFLVTLPIQAGFGLIVAHNVALLFSLVASGYATYLLAFDVTHDRRASLVAGVIFACSGYLVAQALGYLNLIAAEWLPLAVLTLRYAARKPSARTILLAALCIAMNALCDWQYFLFALLWGAWYTITRVWQVRRLAAARPILLALALAVLVVMPLLVPTALIAAQSPGADTGPDVRLGGSADVLDFFIPSQLHPGWGSLAERAQHYKATTIIHNKTAYLGWTTLLLAALGMSIKRWNGRFWLLSAILFATLALGPQLQVAGVRTNLPLPAALLYHLPLVSISRVPLRLVVLVTLSLAMLAALGVRRLLTILVTWVPDRRTLQVISIVMIIGIILMDNLVTPFPIVIIDVPPTYTELAQQTDQAAILEAPFYQRSGWVYMFYQAIHGKPLVGGNLSREQPYPLLEQIPLIRRFAYAQPVSDIIDQDPQAIAASVFAYFNIGHLILHSDGGVLRDEELLTIAQAAAGGKAPREVGSFLVFLDARQATALRRSMATPQVLGSSLLYNVVPPTNPIPFLGVGQGWSEPIVMSNGFVERRIFDQAELLIYSATAHTINLNITLRTEQDGELRLRIDQTELPPVTLQGGIQHIEQQLAIPKGVTSVIVQSVNQMEIGVQKVDMR